MKIAIVSSTFLSNKCMSALLASSGHEVLSVYVGPDPWDENPCDLHSRELGVVVDAVRAFEPDLLLLDDGLCSAFNGSVIARSTGFPRERIVGTAGQRERQLYAAHRFERKSALDVPAIQELFLRTIGDILVAA
jgi:hypothetical protein